MSHLGKEHVLEHAWRYFELHAGQRMTSFNYFLVVGGLILSGMGGVLASPQLRFLGVFLGALLALTSVVFFCLDARTSFLIKHAEAALIALEEELQEAAQVFRAEPARSKAHWAPSYSACFHATFIAFALVGVLGAIASAAMRG